MFNITKELFNRTAELCLKILSWCNAAFLVQGSMLLQTTQPSVHFLNGWATTTASWHTALWHTTFWHSAASCSLVDLHHDRIHNAFELLLLRLKLILLGQLVLVEPIQRLLYSLLDLLLVITLKLLLELLLIQSVAHSETVVLQAILCLNLTLVLLILFTELLSLLHHAINLGLRQATLLVRDRDLVGLSCGLVLSRHIQDAVGINVKCDLDLGHATRCWWDSIKMELAQQVVILGHGALSLEDLNEHTRLIVCISCEGLALLGGDGGVPLDEFCHHTTSSFQAHGQWCHIQEQEILDLG